MKILIAGGTGFLGSAMELYFSDKGHRVEILTRNPRRANELMWDAKHRGDWTATLADTDVLINLTGKSVDCRYTASNKAEILRSRLDSTTVLNKVLLTFPHSVKVFVNSSSATIYEHSLDRPNTEANGIIGSDFSMDVVKAWEKVFYETDIPNVRKAAMRISIVLGHDGGAYPKMKMITKLGLGGHQGRGNQMISWISLSDLVRATEHIIINKGLSGPINVTAPCPITNKSFMKIVRQAYSAPFGISQPKWLLELGSYFLRTETELLLKSRYVLPAKLLATGFRFTYNDIGSCLKMLNNNGR